MTIWIWQVDFSTFYHDKNLTIQEKTVMASKQIKKVVREGVKDWKGLTDENFYPKWLGE